MNWIRPRKPNKTAGYVVINCDDGNLTDYTHWFPIIQRTIFKNNQFIPLKSGIYSPSVNVGLVPGTHRQFGNQLMNFRHMKEIVEKGGEILSHGTHHVYFNYTPIAQSVNVGDVRIYYTDSLTRFIEGQTYTIEEGSLSEVFEVSELISGNPNCMEIKTPLVHSYSANARIHLSHESLLEETQGAVDILAEQGIICKHQINPWYLQSNLSKSYLENIFESVLTYSGSDNIPTENVDLHDLKRSVDIRWFSESQIDEELIKTKDNNTVMFVQGHGTITPVTLNNLEYLINKSFELGLQIVTHTEAVNYLKSLK